MNDNDPINDAGDGGQLASLSAMLDDEASELELRRVLRDAQQSEDAARALGSRWRRMNIVQSLMRGEAQVQEPAYLRLDLSSQLRSAIAQEAEYEPAAAWPEAEGAAGTPWRKQLLGFAAAAGVAALVVLGVQNNPAVGPVDTGETIVAAQPAPAGTASLVSLGGVGIEESSSQAAKRQEALQRAILREKIGAYMRTHAQHASMNMSQGAMPLLRSEMSK